VRWVEEKIRMDLRLSRHVRTLVRDEGYECVVSLSERVGLPLTHQLDPGIKHVVMIHHPMSAAKLRMLRALNAARKWDQVIAISPAEAAGLIDQAGFSASAVKSLLTAVDTDFYRPPNPEIPMTQRDHFQSLGSSHRDYPTLVRAMRKIPDARCELRLGSTWIENRVSFRGEQVPSNIELKTYVPPHELRKWYARGRFVVIPLQDDTQWSAGCTSVQHAQAMGRAIIASDRPGLYSYLINGVTGILVRTGDEQDLREAIEYLWRNPKKAEEMGRNGREWIASTCSMDCWLDGIAGFIAEVSSSAPPAPAPKVADEVPLNG
jgi:glycosyltransferase involved in cell wall biosynthesis